MLEWFKSLLGGKPPELTEQMKSLGFRWQKIEGVWREMCNTCGGNCGQCGTSLGAGTAPSLSSVVKSGNWQSGNHVGLPRSWR